MTKNKKYRHNLRLQLIVALYSCFLLIVCSIAIFYSYYERRNEYINEFNATSELLEKEYKNVLSNFWEIYMPIFEEQSSNYQIMYNYFSNEGALTPNEKKEIANVLKQMILRDNRIQWLAVYRGEQSDNYILFSTSNTLVDMDETFPYWQHLKQKASQMEVYEAKPVNNGTYTAETFAVAGGAMSPFTEGVILAGYDVSCFSQYCSSHNEDIYSDYIIKNIHGTVFNSGPADIYETFEPSENYEGSIILSNNQKYYTKTLTSAGRLSFTVTYFTSWWPLFLHSALTTMLITALFAVFSLLAFSLYMLKIKSMSKKIKETTLAEIQSKFNPHFLYNFLETLREKIYFSGDRESAEALVSLSNIFRKLVSGENFVTIRDEIAFCDMYISLFKNYYSDDLDIVYDIDTDILPYGIIRNLLQPLVENYFVHGFGQNDSSGSYISIKGAMLDDQYIVITYEDNGLGMSPEELEALKQQFISEDNANSYGLKSIYRRIKLFYGKDCGIEIISNTPQGLIIQVKIKKMTLEEHNLKLQN